MKRSLQAAWLALLTAAAGAGAQGVDPVPPEQLFERLAPSVWTVETFDARNQPVATGSAVVIARGRLVTNCHVLAKAQSLQVTRDNVNYGATLEYPDVDRDLCTLKVANFTAPAVTIGNAEGLKIGSRVYAIGSPRGLEQTISDGLLSGLRRTENGDFMALQVTVPISPGSSGGGLFDAYGRLIGITTYQLRDSQNLNFAVPATWIAEVPNRAQAALAARSDSIRRGGTTAPVAERAQVFEYELRDRLTRQVRRVTYRLDRVDGDKLIFNQGTRVEKVGGGVISNISPIGGDFDVAMPPGGWVSSVPAPGTVWQADYRSGVPGQVVSMKVQARALGESTFRLKDRDLRVVQVEFTGYTERMATLGLNPAGRYQAMAWYCAELGRVVRFEASTRGGIGGGAFIVDEQLELVDIRAD